MPAPTFYYPDSDNTDSDYSSCSSSPATNAAPFDFLSLCGQSTSPISFLESLAPLTSSSSTSSPTPPPTRRKARGTTIKAETCKPASRRPRAADHIPRPRNAFMIYRSDFYSKRRVTEDVEHDHRIISRIIGMCWKKLSPEEKKVWFDKAAEEKRAHKLKYPDYRFRPQYGAEPKQKRNVKRNGPKDLRRCAALADAIVKGKQADEIKEIAKTYEEMPEESPNTYTTAVFDANAATSSHTPFRSPLIAPSHLELQPSTNGLQLMNVGSVRHSREDKISSAPSYRTQNLASHAMGVQQSSSTWEALASANQHGSLPLSSSAPGMLAPPYGSALVATDMSSTWAGPAGAFSYIPMPSISNYAASLCDSSTGGFHWAATAEPLAHLAAEGSPSALLQDSVDSALLSTW